MNEADKRGVAIHSQPQELYFLSFTRSQWLPKPHDDIGLKASVDHVPKLTGRAHVHTPNTHGQ